MVASTIQPSFAAGELSPSFFGHSDHQKFRVGCSTLRNCFASIRGGAYSRAGTAFVGQSKQVATPSSTDPRLISFQFKVGQAYILEFGEKYVRFIANGGYITETPFSISAATQANPLVITVPGHTFVVNDWIFVAGALGMTQIDGLTFIVKTVVGNSLTLADTFGNLINSLAFGAYAMGGTAARIYTVVSPYTASDLPYLKTAESADLMSLLLSNEVAGSEYAPQDLDRLAANNWTLTPTTFASSIAAPATCTAAASAAPSGTLPSAQYAYCATAIDATTGQESIASPIALVSSVDIALTTGSITISCATVANAGAYNFYKAPAAVYVNGGTAQTVPIGSSFGFVGSSAGPQFIDQNVIQDFSTTPPLHQNPFSPGQILNVGAIPVTGTFHQTTTTAAINTTTGSGGIILPVVISANVAAAIVVNPGKLYAAGDTVTFTDSNGGATTTAPLTIGPKTGTFPGVVAYFQQRRGYANTLNSPDSYEFSRTGAYTNMDVSDPPVDSDAISGSPWAQQVNGIKWMVPMPGGLIVCTGLDAWQLNGSGGPSTPFTPSSQNATSQETYGFSSTVGPIRIGAHFLYVDSLDSVVRDNVYSFYTNTYAGDDLTQLSNHLFDGHKIVQWAWARSPFKVVWAVRDDGVLLSLTYLKEQEVIAWARHDTNGQVVSVAVATEPPVDAVYVVVKRFIAGKNAYGYYVERMDNRIWPNAETCWCVDAGLALALPTPAATLSAAAASGLGVIFTASAAVFDGVKTGAVGQVIRMGGGKAVVAAYISPTQVSANILIAITATTPDDPSNVVLSQPAGSWSIATPVTTISGLNHLEGMTVTGLADGAVITPTAVTGGAITLASPASAVTVGLPFVAQVQSLHLQKEGEQIQDMRKRVIGVTVRLEKSRGVEVGANQPNSSAQENGASIGWGKYPWGKMQLIPEVQNQLGPNQYLPLFTGDHYIPIDDDWNTVGQSASPGMVAVQQRNPLPLQLLAILPKFVLGDTPTP